VGNALQAVKADATHQKTPVAIFPATGSGEEIKQAIKLDAPDYLIQADPGGTALNRVPA